MRKSIWTQALVGSVVASLIGIFGYPNILLLVVSWVGMVLLLSLLCYRIAHLAKKVRESCASGKRISSSHSIFHDEIQDVEVGYNSLVDRTDFLISQIAEKVGLEKEVQTAEIVQSLFFPSSRFQHPCLGMYGKVVKATQCSGDWWTYKQVGEHLVVGVGDATGHGVAAALMMAAVHGAYSIFMKQCEESSNWIPSISKILELINESSRSVANDENTMTFVSSIVDLKFGNVTVGNASHPPPYILRKSNGDGSDVRDAFVPMMSPIASPLGRQKSFSVESRNFQLMPGDTIFWYTDGFLSSGKARLDGTPDRLSILRFLANLTETHFPDAGAICEAALADCIERRANLPESHADDITLVVATIPLDARFSSR